MRLPDPSLKLRLNTAEAASYLGVSVSLMRLWRLRGPDDRKQGPRFIRLSKNLVVYDRGALDNWLALKAAETAAA
jgi:predicted DNA-binding transcriptional regulator AlpA